MSKTVSRVVGIVAIILSLGSAVWAVSWFMHGRVKHGLLFAVIFVALFLFGLILARSKGTAAPGGPATP